MHPQSQQKIKISSPSIGKLKFQTRTHTNLNLNPTLSYSSCSQTTRKSTSKTDNSTPTLHNTAKFITPNRECKKAVFLSPEDAKSVKKAPESNQNSSNIPQKRELHKFFNKTKSSKIEERKDYETAEDIDEIHMIVNHEMDLDQQFITQTRYEVSFIFSNIPERHRKSRLNNFQNYRSENSHSQPPKRENQVGVNMVKVSFEDQQRLIDILKSHTAQTNSVSPSRIRKSPMKQMMTPKREDDPSKIRSTIDANKFFSKTKESEMGDFSAVKKDSFFTPKAENAC